MKLIGRIIGRILIFGVQRSGYVQDARKNLETWEALYEKADSERMAAAMNKPT